jgi:hypothetical protein
VVDLTILGAYDWRLSEENVWKAERLLLNVPHRPLRYSKRRVDRLRRKYVAFLRDNPGCRPVYYDRRAWTPIPGFEKKARE